MSGIHQHTMEGAKKAPRLIAARQNHAFLTTNISGVLSLAKVSSAGLLCSIGQLQQHLKERYFACHL